MIRPQKRTQVLQIEIQGPTDTPGAACARTLTRPAVQAAQTIQVWERDNHEVNALVGELESQVAAVNQGDLTRAEGILIAQAHTLDELFNNLARQAQLYFLAGNFDLGERYLRLALKAQSQCRTTVETLAKVKNPAIVRTYWVHSSPQVTEVA